MLSLCKVVYRFCLAGNYLAVIRTLNHDHCTCHLDRVSVAMHAGAYKAGVMLVTIM